MGKNINVQETATDRVIKSGDAMIGIGAVLAIIFLALGLIIGASGGNAVVLGLAPLGLLLMITGYLKKLAQVNSALLILAEEERADRIARG
ncbi:hypothetical protein [Glutamicibacter sp. FBE19]|uniref:hypothetical protein n=1 Tax=Glutamicibacter sp. FBE19 TaxID=2761534 RepID=UPI001896414C|nr:hypothetical protein [Glutamicibacter sp. FBE19]MBF6672447.1 hypothetical protein [Glutamicibacter sp. FBE19]